MLRSLRVVLAAAIFNAADTLTELATQVAAPPPVKPARPQPSPAKQREQREDTWWDRIAW
ncbi:MAG: hypothetical protein ACRENL_05250 [Candidatus Dormibacteria bacterium]